MAPIEVREERAFDNMVKAIDMFDMFERVSINNHKSFLPHLSVFKVPLAANSVTQSQQSFNVCLRVRAPRAQLTREIMLVADVWACDLSPLELQNAETKRVASSAGSRRIEFTAEGQTLVGMKGGRYGPERLVKVQMYSTTMALSTMNNNLLVTIHQCAQAR